jgi:hypothetical protein
MKIVSGILKINSGESAAVDMGIVCGSVAIFGIDDSGIVGVKEGVCGAELDVFLHAIVHNTDCRRIRKG